MASELQHLRTKPISRSGEPVVDHDTQPDTQPDPYDQMGGVCPVGHHLQRCSPSGQGRAACDDCQMWWE